MLAFCADSNAELSTAATDATMGKPTFAAFVYHVAWNPASYEHEALAQIIPCLKTAKSNYFVNRVVTTHVFRKSNHRAVSLKDG